VYYEEIDSISSAIAREKELKGWVRKRKIGLIESINPGWNDLDPSQAQDDVLKGPLL